MDILMTMLAIVATVSAFVGSIVGNIVASELYDQTPRLARWMIERAASKLNEDQRSSRLEEWLAHAEACGGNLSQLWHACGCCFAALRLKRGPSASSAYVRVVPPIFDHRRSQTTLRSQIIMNGIGIHSGLPVCLKLGPALADAGYIFVRTGPTDGHRTCHAVGASIIAAEFATVLGDHEGPLVSTAEHLLAALRGMGVDNATIEIDGPEIPIMDGSAADFVAAIDQAGVVALSASRRFIQVLKPIRVAMGDSFGELRPYAAGFRAEVEIDFANLAIGRQSYMFDLNPEQFRHEICRARTFGCMNDIARLWRAGFALGASFDNSVVFDETRLLNTEGLRYADECARHKALDLVGDLALAGLPMLGAYRSVRGGHKLNHAVLNALMADQSAWRIIEVDQHYGNRGDCV
jgi:UDP-3-O-[3-hydroxymyristoyl] N-acetylglucosamine deacetylase